MRSSWESQCRGKKQHTKRQAKKALKQSRTFWAIDRATDGAWELYRCDWCGWWHVGHNRRHATGATR